MAEATLNAEYKITGFHTELRLDLLETAALAVLLHHVAGPSDSLRGVLDKISTALTEQLGGSEDFLMLDPPEVFGTMIDSAIPYTASDDVGISFTPIDADILKEDLTAYMMNYATGQE